MSVDFAWLEDELRLGPLSADDKAVLAKVIEPEFVPEGMPIIHQDTSVQNLYLLRSGSVNVMQKRGGQEHTLATGEEGKTFGEISFFGDESSTASVIADQPCELYKISCEHFRSLMREHPDLALKLMAFVVRSMGEIICRLDSSRTWH